MPVSQITAFKDFPNILKNVKRWLRTDIDQLILVDYACPQKTGRRILEDVLGSDPRVTVIIVDPFIAGPFFNLSHALNIGALAAKHELLFFQEPDICLSAELIDFIKESTDDADAVAIHDLYTFMPKDWKDTLLNEESRVDYYDKEIYRQFIVKNAVFYNVNGFNEANFGWGSATVDLLIRMLTTANCPCFIPVDAYPYYQLDCNTLLQDYYPLQLSNDAHSSFKHAMTLYDKMRAVSCRAQPGRRFGLTEYSPYVKMFMGGKERNFNPGDV